MYQINIILKILNKWKVKTKIRRNKKKKSKYSSSLIIDECSIEKNENIDSLFITVVIIYYLVINSLMILL